MSQRSNFSSKIGFVLAAAGSAVGLGNIWRFPYLAAQYGGGSFLFVYLILAVTFGFTLMITEIAIGRKTGLSAIGAFKKLDHRFGFLGILSAIIPIIIFPYYSVIGGWVLKYFSVFVSGQSSKAAADTYFNSFISSTVEPIGWFFLFIAFTAIVVLFGVQKGIETVSKFMMPILVILSVGIAFYGLTVDGALDGLIYYLKPSLENFSIKTILAAMGQLFYSMSLSMGIMITYGSYLKKDSNLESSVRQIEIFDTGIAFLSGLMIIPGVFAFSGGTAESLNQGPGLMFVTLPKMFNSMPIGNIIGTLFFLLVFFAALTSAISLMETIVSIFRDKFHWKRKFTCGLVTIITLLMGIPSSLGFGPWTHIKFIGLSILDTFDFISNNVLMPILAFFTCIFVGFIIKPKTISNEVKIGNPKFKGEKLYSIMIKWIAPVCLVAILISSILNTLGIIVL